MFHHGKERRRNVAMGHQSRETMRFLEHRRPNDERHVVFVQLLRLCIEAMVTGDHKNGVLILGQLLVFLEELPQTFVIIEIRGILLILRRLHFVFLVMFFQFFDIFSRILLLLGIIERIVGSEGEVDVEARGWVKG